MSTNIDPRWLLYAAAIAAVGYVAYKIVKDPAGVAKATAKAAAEAVGAAATAAATAGVGAAGAVVGAPTPDETTQDPAVSRYIMDHPLGGQWAASVWSGVPAYAKALFMASGSGSPPPAGSPLAARFPELPQASYDETARLVRNHPPDLLDPSTYELASTTWGLGL